MARASLKLRRLWLTKMSFKLFQTLILFAAARWLISPTITSFMAKDKSSIVLGHTLPSIMFATATSTVSKKSQLVEDKSLSEPHHRRRYNEADEALIKKWMDELAVPSFDPSPLRQSILKFVKLVQSQKQEQQQRNGKQLSRPTPLEGTTKQTFDNSKRSWKQFKKRKEKIARKNRDSAEGTSLTAGGRKRLTPEEKKVKNLIQFLEVQNGGRQQSLQQVHRGASEVVDKLVGGKGGDYETSEGEARTLWNALERLSEILPSKGDSATKSSPVSQLENLQICAAHHLENIINDRKSKLKKEVDDDNKYATFNMLEEAKSSVKKLFSDTFDSLVSSSSNFTATFDISERVNESLMEAEELFEDMASAAFESFLQKVHVARQDELNLLEESREKHNELLANATSLLSASGEKNAETESECFKGERLNRLTDIVVESILNGQTESINDMAKFMGLQTNSETSSISSQDTSNLLPKQQFNLYQIFDTPGLHDALATVDWAIESVGGYSPFIDRLVDFVADYGRICTPETGSEEIICTEGSVGDALARAMANAHLWVADLNDALLSKGLDIGSKGTSLKKKLDLLPGMQSLCQAWEEASAEVFTAVKPGRVLVLDY